MAKKRSEDGFSLIEDLHNLQTIHENPFYLLLAHDAELLQLLGPQGLVEYVRELNKRLQKIVHPDVNQGQQVEQFREMSTRLNSASNTLRYATPFMVDVFFRNLLQGDRVVELQTQLRQQQDIQKNMQQHYQQELRGLQDQIKRLQLKARQGAADSPAAMRRTQYQALKNLQAQLDPAEVPVADLGWLHLFWPEWRFQTEVSDVYACVQQYLAQHAGPQVPAFEIRSQTLILSHMTERIAAEIGVLLAEQRALDSAFANYFEALSAHQKAPFADLLLAETSSQEQASALAQVLRACRPPQLEEAFAWVQFGPPQDRATLLAILSASLVQARADDFRKLPKKSDPEQVDALQRAVRVLTRHVLQEGCQQRGDNFKKVYEPIEVVLGLTPGTAQQAYQKHQAELKLFQLLPKDRRSNRDLLMVFAALHIQLAEEMGADFYPDPHEWPYEWLMALLCQLQAYLTVPDLGAAALENLKRQLPDALQAKFDSFSTQIDPALRTRLLVEHVVRDWARSKKALKLLSLTEWPQQLPAYLKAVAKHLEQTFKTESQITALLNNMDQQKLKLQLAPLAGQLIVLDGVSAPVERQYLLEVLDLLAADQRERLAFLRVAVTVHEQPLVLGALPREATDSLLRQLQIPLDHKTPLLSLESLAEEAMLSAISPLLRPGLVALQLKDPQTLAVLGRIIRAERRV
jgi:hypothetical protein